MGKQKDSADSKSIELVFWFSSSYVRRTASEIADAMFFVGDVPIDIFRGDGEKLTAGKLASHGVKDGDALSWAFGDGMDKTDLLSVKFVSEKDASDVRTLSLVNAKVNDLMAYLQRAKVKGKFTFKSNGCEVEASRRNDKLLEKVLKLSAGDCISWNAETNEERKLKNAEKPKLPRTEKKRRYREMMGEDEETPARPRALKARKNDYGARTNDFVGGEPARKRRRLV